MNRWRWTRWVVVAGALGVSAAALAQAGPEPPPAPAAGSGSGSGSGSASGSGSGSGSGSASDDSDIEKALAADAAAQKHPPPPPDTTATGPVGPAPAQSMNPDLSFIADFAFASFTGPALEAGDHDPHDDGFNLQALELAASKAVDPYFKFNGNLNFSNDGVEIEEAYATTLDLPWNLQARAGKFLTQFGRINPTHPHTWDYADAPFMITRVFGGEGNRGVGAELSYLTPLPWYVELLASVTDPRGDDQARSFLPSDATLPNAAHVESVLAAKQFFELDDNWSLLWGLSYAEGPHGGDDLRTHLLGTDVYLKYRPITFGSYTIVSLQSEWLYRRRDELGGAIWDVNGYAQLFWRFAQRWGAGLRYEYGTPARRGSLVVSDPLDPEWTTDRSRYAAAITFWPTEFSRLRAQVQVDDAGWLSAPTYAAFLTLELSVGVHGAHKF
jgi:hypothetical protein